MSCKCVPVYNVTAVSIDTTTGVATITTDAPTPQAGRFDLRWRLCCQQLSPCWTETLNITLGTVTVANVIGRDGNFVRLGQLARQVNCCRIVHCNYTESPSGNVMILDKLPCCTFKATAGTQPTVITVED